MANFDFSEVSKEIESLSLAAAEVSLEEQLAELSNKRGELDFYHREALLALEKKFHEICAPLYDQRAKLIATGEAPFEAFWLKALKNHPYLSSLITEADEELLSKLIDIKLTYLDDSTGFKLDFVFAENDFIDNQVISKTYYLENVKEAHFQNLLFDRTETSEIKWKTGKNLCMKEVTKTQRHKASGVMRTVSKSVETESFFHFFDETRTPAEDEDVDEEALAEIEEEIHVDLELGNIFKLSIVPRAYDWFTGKALEYEEMGSDIGSCDDFSFEGGISGGSDEELPTDDENGRTNPSENPQCKQQ